MIRSKKFVFLGEVIYSLCRFLVHHLELGQLAQLLGSVEDHLSALSGKDRLVRMLFAWREGERNLQGEECDQGAH